MGIFHYFQCENYILCGKLNTNQAKCKTLHSKFYFLVTFHILLLVVL